MSESNVSFRSDVQVIGLVGLAHGVSHFFQLLLPPLFPWIKEELALSYAELGALMAVFFVVSGFGQAAAGFVVDKVGARTVLLAGVGLLALSAVVTGLSDGYAGLALAAAIAGLGNCVFHPADFSLLNRRVSTTRLAHAFSVHGISGNLGYAVAPAFLIGLAQWTGSWRTAALAAAAVAAVVWLLLATNRLLDDRQARAPLAASSRQSGAGSTLEFLRLPQVWLCFAFFFVSALAIGGVQSFAPTALHQLYGMPLTVAALSYTAFMLASAGGMVVGGFAASRRADHDRLIAWCMAAAGAVSVLLGVGIVPALAVLPLMALIGFGSGVANPSRDLLVRAAAPEGATGRVYGTVYSGLDAGMAVAPLIFGLIMDAARPGLVFAGVGVCQFLAIVTAVMVGTGCRRRRESTLLTAEGG